MSGFGRILRILVVAGILLACSFAVQAGVYKWRDAAGNMHFSDTPPPAADAAKAQDGVKQVTLDVDFADAKIENKLPISNPAPDSGATVELDNFKLRLDAANGNNVTVGRIFGGKNCTLVSDMQWNDGVLDLKDKVSAKMVAERFRNFGYRFATVGGQGAQAFGDLRLDAELLKIKFDVCNQIAANGVFGPGSRAYVKVRWTLRPETGDEVLYHGISAGSFDAWKPGGGTEGTVLKALRAATDNLLGDKAFVDHLTDAGGASRHGAVGANGDVKLDVVYGDGSGSFRGHSDMALGSAVTVKTLRGHGSGVLIDASGLALTDAHVVGNETRVQVILDDKVLDAQVLRTDRRNDVALLKFDANGHHAASIARAEPHPGDVLYVVGTPLSLDLSKTVTQGILSAIRQVNGMEYFQTDAAVNPGNSGGPVFNDAGELVALSVSGLVNADGASLNVNYLIPVARALSAVGASHD
ncbi:MAG TPA: trypsin-like peptidase domain-containing protein [Rudaea sp.]|nr:trypsin-like peptidase domain-containing protein [Rudaea sp.]